MNGYIKEYPEGKKRINLVKHALLMIWRSKFKPSVVIYWTPTIIANIRGMK